MTDFDTLTGGTGIDVLRMEVSAQCGGRAIGIYERQDLGNDDLRVSNSNFPEKEG
jgi:hypothetical protein